MRRAPIVARVVALTWLLVGACGGAPRERREEPSTSPSTTSSKAAAIPEKENPKGTPGKVAPPVEEPEEDLQAEERERDPRSATVKLTLVVSPPVKGTVTWGLKRIATLQPNAMTVEFERPRSSGSLDLEIRAEGYLPHHTRMHTDRDDKTSVRLLQPEEARGVLGYKPPADTKKK